VQLVRDVDALAVVERRVAVVRPQPAGSPDFDPYRELTLAETPDTRQVEPNVTDVSRPTPTGQSTPDPARVRTPLGNVPVRGTATGRSARQPMRVAEDRSESDASR